MKIKRLSLDVKLKKDIDYKDLPEKISQAVNKFFLATPETASFHESKGIKLYSYSLLEPIEKDKVYKKGKIYSFTLKYFNQEIFDKLIDKIPYIQNDIFIVLNYCTKDELLDLDMESIYTIVPAVFRQNKENNLRWTPQDDLNYVKESIIKNTVHKYNLLNPSNPIKYYNFIESLEPVSISKIAAVFNYKEGKILANQFIIHLKDDIMSKQMGYIMLGAGVGLSNSLSFGYCEYNTYTKSGYARKRG